MITKAYLMELVKHNKYIYIAYKTIGSFAISIMKIFVRTDEKLILFNSFGGKKFDDSPLEVYKQMTKDPRFKDYKLVWAFHKPDDFPDVENKIKSDSLQYFLYSLKARVWVTNSAIQRGLNYQGKHTFSLNTWHGTPLKKMGLDSNPNMKSPILPGYNVILAQGEYEKNTMAKAYNICPDRFRVFGLPRNDVLAHVSKAEQESAKEVLGIPKEKKVILYAPTFRDYQLDERFSQTLDIPLNYKYWEEQMGDEYVFLLRVHYEVAKHTQLPKGRMWKDVSNYKNLNTLMIASDVLITDYSSIMFDYSILGKPIICFAYDYEEYKEKRGMYFDVRKHLITFQDGNEMADYIFSGDLIDSVDKTAQFRKKFVEEYGSAAKKSVDLIYNEIN